MTQHFSQCISSSFTKVSHYDIPEYQLSERIDTKYILHESQVGTLADFFNSEDFSLVTHDNVETSHCHNQYFDTPDLTFYKWHHNGKRKRHKVRIRTYLDTGISYLEIKKREKEGHTNKKRHQVEQSNDTIPDWTKKVFEFYSIKSAKLRPSLSNSFFRTTFINNKAIERVTIDEGLSFNHNTKAIAFDSIVIVEIKKKKFGDRTRLENTFKEMGIRPTRVSKYCVGIVNLHADCKYNRFKSLNRLIHKTNSKND